jgi:predicted DNA-binding protein YlxM (UPF0122 family)
MVTDNVNLKTIPGTVGFMVSDDGIVYSPDGVERNQYTNGDGYKTASVKLECGKWQTFGVHRLVALAHVATDKDTDELTVNHIDHDIENNEAYNLEWVSVHINNIHASLMRKDNQFPKLILIKPNNEQMLIKSLHEASSIISVDIETSWLMVKNNLSVKGYSLKLLDKIPTELKRKQQPVFDENGRIKTIELFLKDLETGKIEKFNSMKDLANRFNVSSSHIHQCISSLGTKSLFKRRYLIVKSLDEMPDISPEEYSDLKSPTGKQTLIFNYQTKQISIFESASEMIKSFNLSKKAVSTRLRRDGIGQIDDYLFAYSDKQKEFLDKIKSSSSLV